MKTMRLALAVMMALFLMSGQAFAKSVDMQTDPDGGDEIAVTSDPDGGDEAVKMATESVTTDPDGGDEVNPDPDGGDESSRARTSDKKHAEAMNFVKS